MIKKVSKIIGKGFTGENITFASYNFYFFRENLSLVFFGVVKPSYVVMMGMIIFFDTIWSIPMLALRAENRPRLFIFFSFLNVGVTLLCNLLFIIIFDDTKILL